MSILDAVRKIFSRETGAHAAQEFHDAAQRVTAQSENLKRTIETEGDGDDPLGVFVSKIQGRQIKSRRRRAR